MDRIGLKALIGEIIAQQDVIQDLRVPLVNVTVLEKW